MAGGWHARAPGWMAPAQGTTAAGPLRAALLLGVVLLTMSAALAVAPRGAWAAESATVTANGLHLRTGPSTSDPIIDWMFQGDSVQVVDGPTGDGWYEVDFNGEDGWAYGAYLNIGGSQASSDSSGGVGGGDNAGPEHWIDVNRSSQTVSLMVGDQAIDSFWGAMGYDSSSDGFFSTAIGTYYVYSMNAALTWTDWGHVYISDWVGFDPDRQNGFHSYSKDANGNVLPNGDGPTGGCVGLADSAANELYNFAYIGMRVYIHW